MRLRRTLAGTIRIVRFGMPREGRSPYSSATDPTSLMTDLSQRIAHLEHQISQLHSAHLQLASLQSLLQMGESFRALHRHLARLLESRKGDLVEDRRVRGLLARYKLSPAELEMTLSLCRARNEAAHPQSRPDLTEVDPNVTRIFDKVQRLLADLAPTK